MLETQGYAAYAPKEKLKSFKFKRREPGDEDVLIEILYCGICHSDIHQARNEWGIGMYPIVPGHEILGKVIGLGAKVKRFRKGDLAGVGCYVSSCGACENCKDATEQFCEKISWTYGGTEPDGKTPTYGGYSSQITVNENYVYTIPEAFQTANLASVAPLFCAGITTFSPLKEFNVKPGHQVAVLGLGGLGHMAVKLAASMGAEVTVLSTSKDKAADAKRLGAKTFCETQDPKTFNTLQNHFDFILDTVSASHDPNLYLRLLKKGGVMTLVGAPEKPLNVHAFSLIMGRKKIGGSLIGGVGETQTMLEYCAKKEITADVEVIPIQEVNAAFDRAVAGKVRYRFVIDLKTLK